MAQRGRSDWERQHAAQRREAERQARELARQAKERAKAQHVVEQQQLAETKTAKLTDEIRILDQVLLGVLDRSPITFAQLKVQPRPAAFQPGRLAEPVPTPNWEEYAPVEPRGVDRWFGGMNQYRRDLAAAQRRYQTASDEYQAAEAQRQKDLQAAQTAHKRKVGEADSKVAAYNRQVDQHAAGFAVGEAPAVEWFVNHILRASRYPQGFPTTWQVAYRPENRDVVVELELPGQQVVPAVREYRYIKTRDAIDPVARPITEIKQRYARLIARIALRTLHEIFRATPAGVIEAVVFNGRVNTTDRATGKKVRPHLISVEAERAAFDELVLAEVDPAACLAYLNALVSDNRQTGKPGPAAP